MIETSFVLFFLLQSSLINVIRHPITRCDQKMHNKQKPNSTSVPVMGLGAVSSEAIVIVSNFHSIRPTYF